MVVKKQEKKSFFARHPEAKGLLLIALSIIMQLSLFSFHNDAPRENWLGLVGHAIAFGFTYVFGLGSFLLMFYLGYVGVITLSKNPSESIKAKNFYFGTFLFAFCILLNLIAEVKLPFPDILLHKVRVETIVINQPYPHMHIRHNLGGVPLYYLYTDLPTYNLKHLLSNVGIGITFSIIAIVATLLFTEIQAVTVWEKLKKLGFWAYKSAKDFELPKKEEDLPVFSTDMVLPPPPVPREVKVVAAPAPKKREAAPRKPALNNSGDYILPPASMLRIPKQVDPALLKKDLRKQAALLEETLLSFGIEAKVGDIHCGPTITSFEVHPSVGVKVQKIKALENDIALNLQAKSIRIIAPIPGKAVVGVEVPSLIPQEVGFRELLEYYQHGKQKAQIPILLGKTVTGEIVMSDLAKMPHCIIAGATGSGKSVCINTIVMSIVMNARPDEIKLLMVDPKKVELTGYTNLPHMIAPVITEAHGAFAALNWLVKEMQVRYEILKQLGLRNITAFNMRKRDIQFEESLDIPIPETMPKLVAIIDEFADLMMAADSDLETPIARIAQMARAVGIHLILATQRPSREVITGLIKANFPTRIAFKVASRVNSQIILDDSGAESLLGNGDMLFLPPGSSHLIRAQGTYISDEEINQINEFICSQAPPKYLIPSFDRMPKEEVLGSEEGKDSLYDQARSIVIETGTASTTFLQRKLKIGYARAASLMDELEQNGVIGPQEGAKPRRILIGAPKDEE
ncbi:MAG: DNA translocase FtsK 4TM domain-containing protein [Verrucomicrobia bacterium]|nr:DNA translocase FtsK 4TM domain-containing protein [Verrucomicrobiota bacterium]